MSGAARGHERENGVHAERPVHDEVPAMKRVLPWLADPTKGIGGQLQTSADGSEAAGARVHCHRPRHGERQAGPPRSAAESGKTPRKHRGHQGDPPVQPRHGCIEIDRVVAVPEREAIQFGDQAPGEHAW